MLLGAMLGLGVPLDFLREELDKLGLPGWSLNFEVADKCGLSANLARITVEESPVSRGLKEIRALFGSKSIPERVADRATRVFTRLAEAEAKVHGCKLEDIHFHEVGALDAIIDVVGFCFALEFLQPDELYCGTFPMGEGEIRCAHGLLPNPAPATLHLLKGWPLRNTSCKQELVTPTGASILTTLTKPGRPPGTFVLENTAFGAGQRDLDFANVLRASIFSSNSNSGVENLLELECDIDDCNPEILAYALDSLIQAGALDASVQSIQMKKGRAGHRLWCLCSEEKKGELSQIILSETSTLGLRIHRVERVRLEREFLSARTDWGIVGLKRISEPSGGYRYTVEFEDARRLAKMHRVPLQRVYDQALNPSNRNDSDANNQSSPSGENQRTQQ